MKGPDDGSICFCRTLPDGETISCSNEDCPYGKFHPSFQSLTNVTILKKWYCPHCSRLQQFKGYSRKQTAGKAKGKASVSAVSSQASLCDAICICKVKATTTDRLVECHGSNCTNGKFFHLQCLGLKRMPTNHKTTWRCYICRQGWTLILRALAIWASEPQNVLARPVFTRQKVYAQSFTSPS